MMTSPSILLARAHVLAITGAYLDKVGQQAGAWVKVMHANMCLAAASGHLHGDAAIDAPAEEHLG